MVVQRQVAPQLGTGFTKRVHNFRNLADLTAMTVGWETHGEKYQPLITNSNANDIMTGSSTHYYFILSRSSVPVRNVCANINILLN